MLAGLLLVATATAQTPDYSQFKTDDEENNIEIFKSVSPSVVNITNSRLVRSFYSFNPQEVPQGSGTGFVWNKEGYIVTNYHVVQQADRVTVTLQDGTSYSASAVGVDPDKDLAVLRIDAPDAELVAVQPGDSSQLEVGRKVIAIGNPFGFDTTMTVGVVSALGREIDSVSRRKIRDVIQTDAAINPGNSGGPLLDSAGRLIGVNTAIFSPSGAFSGIGFAIPVDEVNRVVPQIIQHGRVYRAGLGVSILPDSVARDLELEGVIVNQMGPDSAAATAGLKPLRRAESGAPLFDLIVKIDDKPITSGNDLHSALYKHSVDDEVSIQIIRNPKSEQPETQTLHIRLQALN